MQSVTHYPHVPLSTTNVGTELARVDNLQKPPLLPPQQATPSANERPLNQYDKSPQPLSIQEKQQHQGKQGQQEQANVQQAPTVAEKLPPKRFVTKPALSRRDLIKPAKTPVSYFANQLTPPKLASHLIPLVRQHVQNTYQLNQASPAVNEFDVHA
ncbi:hypothetical protein FJQ87_00255 [Shewanella sp. SNU WT4]|uniref:hypothetical protein n=1 Tax=Shewanella sp. SNU WT4 TaxID=2590015 RepID=UPI0011264339|nr:hypothetical protein [Shewanella sp. SNU WT4]QDF65315.1 hypothetical protein FJQ87_00255 [Shewanella sp. SNU WT4]